MNKVYAKIFPNAKRLVKVPGPNTPSGSLSDQDLIAKVSSGRNGTKFSNLYQGDWEKYFQSQSEADQSFCNLLAFHTNDTEQIDRIFCDSGLYREKWDRDDYRSMTFDKALGFDESSTSAGRKSQADILLELIEAIGIELFHDSASVTYIRFLVNGHVETWLTKAKATKLWLAGQFYEATRKAIGPDALKQALGVLEAKARFEGPKIELSLRVAERENTFWYDLANDDWQAVRIEPGAWHVVGEAPPLFISKMNKALEFLGKPYSTKEIDWETCIYLDMKNGYDIEVSGINHPEKGSYCNYVCVWDVRNGKNQGAKSVEYVRDIKNLLELKTTLDKLCENYGRKDLIKSEGVMLVKDQELLEPFHNEYHQLSAEMKERLGCWINDYIQPANTMNHQQSSYTLKHLAENGLDHYISNDQLKMAMLYAGYKPINSKELNWHFKIRNLKKHKSHS
ncbi:hypothetical protein [Desulfosporosinus sp. FKA]|uniref:phage NrS-1 polymerase family protein n=1 Tax=Desulfosporosinus sp. FKA TaxID=1969834 RepID=UPI000B49A470|nr:hypothetical protein [Desulfosporosinus sp. FKA]